MLRVAIVEDETEAKEVISAHLKRYCGEKNIPYQLVWYNNGLDFLAVYNKNFDVVLLDIMLPDINGMETARKLRDMDNSVALVFVTNMAQFAVSGYEVNAFDFVVKPVTYGNLSLKLDRALPHFIKETQRVSIYSPDGTRIVPVSEIKYVEVMNHRIVWHTTEGDLSLCGSLKKAEEQLPPSDYCRINNCYIVNLKYVTSVGAQTIVCAGDELSVSRPRRRDFMRAMTEYIEGGRR